VLIKLNKEYFSSIEYLIPKVGAEKSLLFSRDYLNSLINLKSIKNIIENLKNTKYGELIEYLKPETTEDLEFIIEEFLISKYNKMIKASPEVINKFLSTMGLKFEIQNIKKLIKAKILNLSINEINKLVHMSIEHLYNRYDLFNKLIYSGSLIDLINSIKIDFYSSALKEALHAYQDTKTIYLFDCLLDLDYFKLLIEEAKNLKLLDNKFIRNLLKLEADIYNILTVMRSKHFGLKSHQILRLIVHDPILSPEIFYDKLIKTESFKESLHLIKKRFKNDPHFDQIDSIEMLYLYLNKIKLKFYIENSIMRFSIEYPISTLKILEFEAKNLISIINGVNYGLEPEDIFKNLILLD